MYQAILAIALTHTDLLDFQAEYLKWATANNFPSMLPSDTKWRWEEAASSSQSNLESHLVPKQQDILYSDSIFHQAVVQWLIAMDQPIHATEHPAFRKMVNIASRATNAIKVPSRKQT
ncbi:hypothetical protein PISMIDRAFT_93561 [Pisolithus microcarpus 441]|uniref:Unplaced genomic scaffold scaffold_13, whole genome shotgun sequence n=1 Tax=Pisolithus microcarpus 441 TaxID=765257 RepID=A0A0C9ZCY1_9AGAM|nr:hypothetical protein PISMIDRAFT_93561 [Pisolithus microcarpus 441]